MILELTRHHAGGLESLHDRQIGDCEQRAQCRTWCRVAGANTEEQHRAFCGTNHIGRMDDFLYRRATEQRHR
jgi:hypothetical protein